MEPKARAAERLLRRLGVAVKTFALYPPPHSVTDRAIADLLNEVHQYTGAFGPFAVRIAKHALWVDTIKFEGGANGNLAFFLYSRKVSHLKIIPGVSDQELTSFLSVVGKDRAALEAEGGIEHLLWQAKVENIRLHEMALKHEGTVQVRGQDVRGQDTPVDLVGQDRLAPDDRERVIELLGAGPEQAVGLLERASEGTSEQEQEQQVYQAVMSLDRLILDEPFEDQQQLYANLAEALSLVGGSLQSALESALTSHAGEDETAMLLLSHLPAERLAQVVLGLLSHEDAAERVATLLRMVSADQEKTKAILALVEDRLRPPGGSPTWQTSPVMSQLQVPASPRTPEIDPEFEFGDSQDAIGHQEAEYRVSGAEAVEEVAVNRAVVSTLVDVLRFEIDKEELGDLAGELEGHLVALADNREFELLARILEGIKDVASSETGGGSETATNILKRIPGNRVLDQLLSTLWDQKEVAPPQEILACLQALADGLVGPLMRLLGDELRSTRRAMLCDLLVTIGRGHVDELGGFVSDKRWYLVRNTANILGRLGSPGGVAYLARLVDHDEYRVRREAVDGLIRIGTGEAQAVLAAFLDDKDPRIQVRVLEALEDTGVRRALPKLLALLGRRDPFNRQFALRRAAIEVLERAGAKEALHALKRLASSRIVLGQRGRELRHLARVAVAAIDDRAPVPEPALLLEGGGQRK